MSKQKRTRSWQAAALVAWDFAVRAPLPLLTTFFVRMLNAARPGLFVFITAGFVNALIQGKGALRWTLALAAVQAMELLTDAFSGPAREWLQNAATLRVQFRVLERASRVPLARFLDPDFHDRLSRAGKDLGERLARWINSVLYLTHSAVAVTGLVGVILALGGGPVVAAVVAAGSLLGLLSSGPIARLHVERSQRTARPQREAAAWAGFLSGRPAAPEVRLFGLQEWIRTRWAAAYQACAHEDIRVANRELGFNALGTAAGVGAYAVVLVFSGRVALTSGPDRAAGVFAGLLLTVQAMQSFLRELLNSVNRMNQSAGVIGDLAALFAEPDAAETARTLLPQEPARVTVDGLSFRYPAAAADTVADLSFRIEPGEVVALVGPNGAGKSTLSALLLGLHRPSSGTVRLNGEEVAGSGGSAVFQEFTRYALPVRENVGFSDLLRLTDDKALQAALRHAGSGLHQELDSWLGTEFGGRDLSGGEWLRVAIARGLLPRSGLIVLDEPTAAIDPLAEVELVKRLLSLGEGRTAVVVSHRLGVARLADRILVMDEGRLVETGTHDRLLAANGLYARMWRAQASWYSDAPEPAVAGAIG